MAFKFTYKDIADKVQKHISSWSASTLALVRWITLCKVVLYSIPLYAMLTTLLPVGISNEVESFDQEFFCGIPILIIKNPTWWHGIKSI